MLPVVLAVLFAVSCKNDGSSGLTVPSSDSTAPELSLTATQENPSPGVSGGVQAGGSNASMTLIAKTGNLNLLANAKDPESGISTVQIWVELTTTTCDASGVCTMSGPARLGNPWHEDSNPPKSPGQSTSVGVIDLQFLDLSTQIPSGPPPAGGTLTVRLGIWAVAVNNLGKQAQTARLTATWSE